MTTSLRNLLKPSQLRRIAMLAAFALFVGGIAQAAHIHKSAAYGNTDVHAQCLLCMHADRAAGPAELPRVVLAVPLGLQRVIEPGATPFVSAQTSPYQARGPPRV